MRGLNSDLKVTIYLSGRFKYGIFAIEKATAEINSMNLMSILRAILVTNLLIHRKQLLQKNETKRTIYCNKRNVAYRCLATKIRKEN